MNGTPTWVKFTIGAISVVVVGLGAYVAWSVLHDPGDPPPTPLTSPPAEIVGYLASEEFDALGETEQDAYYDKIVADLPRPIRPDTLIPFYQAAAELTDEQRERIERDDRPLSRRVMFAMMTDYFQMSPNEKTAYLDEMLDSWGGGRDRASEASQTEEDGPRRGGGGGRDGFTPAMLKHIIENTTPEQRAMFIQFMKDMREHMANR
jgi:hypothetical protein